ncbi:MAG: hypothetical protein QXS02_02380 [Candidatus Thermoplasmatota archaeon]
MDWKKMGLSLSASSATILLSSLIIFETISGALIALSSSIHESYESLRNDMIKKLRTDFVVTDLSSIKWYKDSPYVNITVRNTGDLTLRTGYITILINGIKTTFTTESAYIYPNHETILMVNLPLTEFNRLTIITENGIVKYSNYPL